jgi:hypothetical protein
MATPNKKKNAVKKPREGPRVPVEPDNKKKEAPGPLNPKDGPIIPIEPR